MDFFGFGPAFPAFVFGSFQSLRGAARIFSFPPLFSFPVKYSLLLTPTSQSYSPEQDDIQMLSEQ